MKPAAAIALIKNDNIPQQESAIWADLGCGAGLFTYALSTLLPPGSFIYAIDKEPVSLNKALFADNITLHPLQADFVKDEFETGQLDGILMANSLHYVQDQPAFIKNITRRLKADACFLIVEYDMISANPWVPFPLSYAALTQLFKQAGYYTVKKLEEQPSIYGRANMYAAIIKK